MFWTWSAIDAVINHPGKIRVQSAFRDAVEQDNWMAVLHSSDSNGRVLLVPSNRSGLKRIDLAS
jgi:hypothetical protein